MNSIKIPLLTLFLASILICQGINNGSIIEKTKKISVVFIGSEKGLSESSFGHIALRLSQGNRLSVTDATIEFVADMPEKVHFLKKIIF